MSQLWPYLDEWLNLLVRWLHVTAAIAWIGSSFYFIALDLSLKPPKDPADDEAGVGGEAWEIHGGGIYQIQKYRLAPRTLPEHMAWFKWEAYTTWLSGFGLLTVLYFANAQTYLVDRQVADLSVGAAVLIACAVLAAAWLVYDGLCRLLEKNDRLLAVLIAVYIVIETFGLSHVFSARAVYLLVGASIGTMMAANVLFVIIPGQRELVRAKQEDREPDPIWGRRGKQRSVHNNYLTLPVLFAMLSNHFSFTYQNPNGWILLLAIMGLAAWFRHFFNLLHQGRLNWVIPATTAAGMIGVALVAAPPGLMPWTQPAAASSVPVPFATAQGIVNQRCLPCHSQHPTQPGFAAPPLGVTFDTPQEMHDRAQQMYQKVVVEKSMPLGNLTNMTDQERQTFAAWVQQGAQT